MVNVGLVPEFLKENGWLAVIAGGEGMRLFPLSHHMRPKQFVKFDGQNALIQATVQRYLAVGFTEERVIVITTNGRQTELAREQLCGGDIGVLPQNIIQIDPRFGYVGAMHYAARTIYDMDSEAVILNTASDQIIKSNDDFHNAIIKAMTSAFEDFQSTVVGVKVTDLVTFTGCGHLTFSKEESRKKVRKVSGFIEKPNEEKARRMMMTGDSLCNTSINCWRASTLLGILGSTPILPKPGEKGMQTDELMQVIIKESDLRVVLGKFKWNDCGTLSALYDTAENKSRHKNVYWGGRIYRYECNESLIATPPNSKTHIYGSQKVAFVQNFVEGVLVTVVCRKSASHLVKVLADIYSQHDLSSILLKDFQVSAKNNHFHSASLNKEEAICGFVGVDDVSVSIERDPDTGEIINSVKFQN